MLARSYARETSMEDTFSASQSTFSCPQSERHKKVRLGTIVMGKFMFGFCRRKTQQQQEEKRNNKIGRLHKMPRQLFDATCDYSIFSFGGKFFFFSALRLNKNVATSILQHSVNLWRFDLAFASRSSAHHSRYKKALKLSSSWCNIYFDINLRPFNRQSRKKWLECFYVTRAPDPWCKASAGNYIQNATAMCNQSITQLPCLE